MNMNRIHNIQATILLLATALLASCSQDELADNSTALPTPIPLELATDNLYETVATRGTVDGDWQDALSVAVRVNEATVKEYTVTPAAGGGAQIVPLETPGITETDFWWTKQNETKQVDAWYPYQEAMPADWSVSTVQTAETLKQEDLMYAKRTAVSLSNSSIIFEHVLAKVNINLASSPYLDQAADVKVYLDNQYVTGTFTYYSGDDYIFQGKIGTLANQTIEPYRLPTPSGNNFASYTAIVIPLDIVRVPAIRVMVDGTIYKYDFPTGYGGFREFGSNCQYTCNITVKEEGLSVNGVQITQWDTGASGSGSVTL